MLEPGDPLSNLMEAKRMLKPDGILAIAVPNIENYIYKIAYMFLKLKTPKILSKGEGGIHLYHFSLKTLKKMIEKANFLLIKADIDKERIFTQERILDVFAWVLYKILRVNFGIAFEIYAKKN